MHDHIVGKDGHASLKGMKLLRSPHERSEMRMMILDVAVLRSLIRAAPCG